MKRPENGRYISWAAVTGALLLWEGAVRVLGVRPWILPPPSMILAAAAGDMPVILSHMLTTCLTALGGFAAALVVAFIISILMDVCHPFRAMVYPFMVVSQTVPIVFIYPLFLIWFGFGVASRVIVVVLVCFFPIAVNLTDGLDSADRDILSLFRSMGSGKVKTFTMVKLPGALPSLFTGLRIAAAYSIIGAVIGEWLGAKKGIGVYMIRSYRSFATDRVFAAIALVSVLSLGVFQIVRLFERKLIPWQPEIQGVKT